MRRSASELINELESRIAKLEGKTSSKKLNVTMKEIDGFDKVVDRENLKLTLSELKEQLSFLEQVYFETNDTRNICFYGFSGYTGNRREFIIETSEVQSALIHVYFKSVLD
jgi:hypothetical protein